MVLATAATGAADLWGRQAGFPQTTPPGKGQPYKQFPISEFKHTAATDSIRAGLAAPRKRRIKLGRPQTVNAHRGDVARLRARGLTGRAIAKELGIPSSTAFKIIGQLKS
jgi:hypothetical protein